MKVYKVSSTYDESMQTYVPDIKVNNAIVYSCCNDKMCIVYTDADINAEKIGEEYEFNFSKCVELLKRYSG